MDPNLEVLGSFDLPESEDTVVATAEEEDEAQEEEELFSVVFRARPTPGAGSSGDKEEEEADDEGVINAPTSPTKKAAKKGAKKPARETRELPPAADFNNIFRHCKDRHPAQSNLPPELQLDQELAPINIFTLFFNDKVFSALTTFTNAYAVSKEAGLDESRRWEETTPAELRIFIGIIIYMGVFRQGSVNDRWSNNLEYPQYTISHFMTLFRFQQLKRYLHVSNPNEPEQHWFPKIEPLSTKLATDFARFYVPSTNVSIDEMTVRFSGGSGHTIRMKNKHIPEGYKILPLCQAGYIYSFLYTSRIESIISMERIAGLTMTSLAVVHLAKSFPYSALSFNIYMDNYFSKIPLFKYLRDLNIGTCGTVRINTSCFPKAKGEQKREAPVEHPDWYGR